MIKEKKVRLLIIDEQEAYYNLIKEYVEMYSHEFKIECEHARGDDAHKKIGSFLPSIIVLDAHLETISYLEILKHCGEGIAPVVVMSTSQNKEIADSAIECGAEAFIPKSEDPDDVEFVLTRLALMGEEDVYKVN
ncbi:MAG: response regulator transcription factor [Bdellovibrionales bacterium]|nr:response regulator transcription factor [Bdellovibrionales bacterium]